MPSGIAELLRQTPLVSLQPHRPQLVSHLNTSPCAIVTTGDVGKIVIVTPGALVNVATGAIVSEINGVKLGGTVGVIENVGVGE